MKFKLFISSLITLCMLLLLYSSCKRKTEEPKTKALYFHKKGETQHFDLYYDDGLDSSKAYLIANTIEQSYDSIVAHLQPGPLPKIRIAIWSNQTQFEADMGNQAPGAAGYVYSKEEIRLSYTGSPGMLKGVVHEFVHAVTLFMAENFGNNPRWLWESVAQYEAGAKTDLKTLPYMVNGTYPSFDELSREIGGDQRIYPLGYCISEFIVETKGYEGLRALIRNYGDVHKTFGVSQENLEEQWQAFIETRYQLK